MITCPKCGFVQPPDQFCAQCGIDIHSYKPKNLSLVERIRRNKYLQFSLVSIFIFASVVWVIQQNRDKIEDITGTQFLSNEDIFEETEEISMEPEIVQQPIRQEVQLNSTNEELTEAVAKEDSGEAPEKEAATPVTVWKPSQVKVTFVEVSNGLLSDYGRYQVGTFSQKQLNDARDSEDLRDLIPATSESIENGNVIEIFTGVQDPDLQQNVGLTIQIVANENDGRELNVEVLRELVEPQEEGPGIPNEQVYQEQLTLKPEQITFIGGTLPHQGPLAEANYEFFSQTALKVFNSPDFREGQSEFLILIEPIPSK